MYFTPALIDAKEMYGHICRNSKDFESFPIQFIPVPNLPDWVNPEHRQEPCVMLMEESSETKVCLAVNSSNMIETIDKTIKHERETIAYLVPSIANTLNCSFTTVSGKKLVKMYEHALLISEKLQIATPPIYVVAPEQLPGDYARRCTILNEDDAPIGDIIMIRPAGTLKMIHSIAHELRHCWQEFKSTEEYYKNYIPSGYLSYEDFNFQIEEVDAEAYACCYIDSLGYDGMMFTYHEDVDPDLYHAIKYRMKTIKARTSF